jgi:hypothetical protein
MCEKNGLFLVLIMQYYNCRLKGYDIKDKGASQGISTMKYYKENM